MQVEAFRTFREFTDGASAIQSRNYKILESLCRTPDLDRLASAAYLSVPEVRERVLAGNFTLDEAFEAACASGYLTCAEREKLTAAMGRFAATLRRWRQTHYSLASADARRRTPRHRCHRRDSLPQGRADDSGLPLGRTRRRRCRP